MHKRRLEDSSLEVKRIGSQATRTRDGTSCSVRKWHPVPKREAAASDLVAAKRPRSRSRTKIELCANPVTWLLQLDRWEAAPAPPAGLRARSESG